MKIKNLLRNYTIAAVALWCGGTFTSCNSDDIEDGAMYTFVGETVASYCKNTPELTRFYEVLERSGETALLEVYGHFTCFAPTNEAIEAYLAEKGYVWEEMTQEQLVKMVHNCIIRSSKQGIMSGSFKQGTLSENTMSDRVLTMSLENRDGQVIYLVSGCEILTRDNEVHNGVVHTVAKVIEPSENTLLGRLQEHGGFDVWADAFEASGWADETKHLYDPDYVNPYGTNLHQTHGYVLYVPDQIKMGYTMFVEPDALLAKHGITDKPGMEQYARQYYGSEDLGDYKSRKNPLNRFIAYHILNRQMGTSAFFYPGHMTTPAYKDQRKEYYETLYKNHVIKMMPDYRLNVRNSNGDCIQIDPLRSNIDAVNGMIHTLRDKILVHDDEAMRTDILHERIRFDAMSCIPQATNCNIRWHHNEGVPMGGHACTLPPNACGEYFTYNDAGAALFWGSAGWGSFQEDEINMKGGYDFKLRLIPIPPGSYELRIGYNSESWRGMGQVYIDGEIAGTPISLNFGGTDPRVGWVADAETKDDGVENDKMMRNRGYMKGPEAVMYRDFQNMRHHSFSLRYIIGQFNFPREEGFKAHILRARNVDFSGREFQLDYFEFIPTDMLRDEGRD